MLAPAKYTILGKYQGLVTHITILGKVEILCHPPGFFKTFFTVPYLINRLKFWVVLIGTSGSSLNLA